MSHRDRILNNMDEPYVEFTFDEWKDDILTDVIFIRKPMFYRGTRGADFGWLIGRVITFYPDEGIYDEAYKMVG